MPNSLESWQGLEEFVTSLDNGLSLPNRIRGINLTEAVTKGYVNAVQQEQKSRQRHQPRKKEIENAQ